MGYTYMNMSASSLISSILTPDANMSCIHHIWSLLYYVQTFSTATAINTLCTSLHIHLIWNVKSHDIKHDPHDLISCTNIGVVVIHVQKHVSHKYIHTSIHHFTSCIDTLHYMQLHRLTDYWYLLFHLQREEWCWWWLVASVYLVAMI